MFITSFGEQNITYKCCSNFLIHLFILTSELYKAKPSALVGIESVQKNCKDDSRYERLTAKNGKPYFNLKAANHQVIGTSQLYSSEQSREKGIDSVKNNGVQTVIKDLT